MVRVDPGHSTTLRLPDGMTVSVPAGVVTRPGTLSATIISAPARAPSELMLTGPVYDLRLSGTTFRGGVRLTVPVIPSRPPGQSAAPDAALLAYYSHSSGDWQPVNASYDSATHVLSATSAHLSVWSVLQVNPQQMLDAMHSALLGFLGVANSPRPDCPGSSSLASSGVQVTADTGDLVSWCPDVTSAGVVLRIVSKRTYALEASYLSDWSATLACPVDPVTTAILKGIPVITPRASGPGVHTSIIPGGAELDVQPQPGTSGKVVIGASGEGIFIDALTYAATTLALVYGRLPAAAASTAVKTSEVISDMCTDSVCVKELSAAYGNPDISTSQAAGELFRSLTDVAASCLAKYWPKVYQVSGPSAAFLANVLLWAADGIKLIVTDLHAQVDIAFNPLGAHIDLRSLPLPEFYYADAVLPEAIYASPTYPKELAIDNHEGIAIQSLDAWLPGSMIMTGILDHDQCQPDCAAGPIVTFPVRVVATDSRTCALKMYQSGSTLPTQAYVYSKVTVSALSGNPPSYLVGDSVFKVCS
jgi:hypothetical protein